MGYNTLMSWQLWVLLSGVLTGLGQMIGKSQIHKISAIQMGLIRDLTGLFVAVGVWVYFGMPYGGYNMIFGMMNGAMVAVGVALYFMAVRTSFSGASVFGYLISQVMIVISSAVIFSEWVYFDPSRMRGLGNIAVLVLTVISMLLYMKSLKSTNKWMGILILSALINVTGNLVAKHFVSGEMSVWSYFLSEQIGLTTAGFILLKLRGQDLRIDKKEMRVGIWQGLVAITGPIIYLNILSTEPLSLASLVRRIAAILVTSISGLFWYREGKTLGSRGIWSLIIGFVAFVLVMWVNR